MSPRRPALRATPFAFEPVERRQLLSLVYDGSPGELAYIATGVSETGLPTSSQANSLAYNQPLTFTLSGLPTHNMVVGTIWVFSSDLDWRGYQYDPNDTFDLALPNGQTMAGEPQNNYDGHPINFTAEPTSSYSASFTITPHLNEYDTSPDPYNPPKTAPNVWWVGEVKISVGIDGGGIITHTTTTSTNNNDHPGGPDPCNCDGDTTTQPTPDQDNPCDCNGQGGDDPTIPDFDPSETSDDPVYYADGVVDQSDADLSSDAFGAEWGVTRDWTNNSQSLGTLADQLSENQSEVSAIGQPDVFGNNVVENEMPRLLEETTTTVVYPPSAAAASDPNDGVSYDAVGPGGVSHPVNGGSIPSSFTHPGEPKASDTTDEPTVTVTTTAIGMATNGNNIYWFDANNLGGMDSENPGKSLSSTPGTTEGQSTIEPYTDSTGALGHANVRYLVPQTVTIAQDDGSVDTFYGFDHSIPLSMRGQFEGSVDANGVTVSTTYVGGFLADVTRSYTAAGITYSETYAYTYGGTVSGINRVTGVQLSRTNSATSTTDYVQDVQYAYYGYNSTDAGGNLGDLEYATTYDGQGPADAIAANRVAVSTDYYRYYTSDVSGGYIGGLKTVVTGSAYARLVASLGGTAPGQATDAQVDPFADYQYTYDSSGKIASETVAGAGGTHDGSGSTGQGTFTYQYLSGPGASILSAADPNEWATETIETMPDGNANIVFTNSWQQVMLQAYDQVQVPGHPSPTDPITATDYHYTDSGQVDQVAYPSAFQRDADGAWYNPLFGNPVQGYVSYLSPNAGLVETVTYAQSTTAQPAQPIYDGGAPAVVGDIAGYVQEVDDHQGTGGAAQPQESWQYAVIDGTGANGMGRTIEVGNETTYGGAGGSDPRTTSYAYTFSPGTTHIQEMDVTLPPVSSAQNGPGASSVESFVYDGTGRTIWTRDADGHLTYKAYDTATGALVKTIQDVVIGIDAGYDPTLLPSAWAAAASGGLGLVTTYAVDDQGRDIRKIDPSGRLTVWTYNDPAHEVREYDGWTGTAATGPTTVYREDWAGGYTESLTLSATPSTTVDGLPNGTEPIANVQSLSRTLLNAAGQAVETDDYFNLSGIAYSTAAQLGALGTNYYATKYGYDVNGNQDQTTDANGTIQQTVYNGRGQVASVWVGTAEPAGWSPTNTAGGNLVDVQDDYYDGDTVPGGIAGGGDGNLTEVVTHAGSGQGDRVTTYGYDFKDEPVLKVDGAGSTGGGQPIVSYTTYDNAGEATEVQQYAGAGFTTNADGTLTGADASLLRAQSTATYDDMGRVYQQTVYSVDPTAGSVGTADTTNSYYNLRGELMATESPTGLWTKYAYDGAGRLTDTSTGEAGGNLLLDGSFEEDQLDGGDFQYAPTGGAWTFANGSGIESNGSAFGAADAPDGTQAAFLQTNDSNAESYGSISQDVDLQAGTYTLTFETAQRDGYNAQPVEIHVVVDGVATTAGTVTPSSTDFETDSVQFTVAQAGEHTIEFYANTGDTEDNDTFIDNVQLTGGPPLEQASGPNVLLSQTHYAYDADGNVVETVTRDREPTDSPTATGDLGDESGTGGPAARVSYADSYYDAANRLTATVNLGTNGGAAWTRPTTVPARSATALVTSYAYDAAGNVATVTDPKGLVTAYSYDALGRTTQTVADYTGGTPTNSSNQTTAYAYDGDGHVTTMTAVLPAGQASQTTQYIYGVTTGGGSGIDDNDLLARTEYPDPTTGNASAAQAESYTYDALGEQLTYADRNGTTHAYSYDALGRMTADAVTAFGTGVDQSVAKLGYTYNDQGLLATATSYAPSGAVVNQTSDTYDGFGQLASEAQSVWGAVTASTPTVGYTYDTANGDRLTGIVYPNGRTLTYSYGAAGSLSSAASQITSLSDAGGPIQSYTYMGLATPVTFTDGNGTELSYVSSTGATGDAGDTVTGLDRFGRVVNQNWSNASDTTVDGEQYTYDQDSNVLSRRNSVLAGQSELYSYDGLNRLVTFARGTLNGSGTAVTGTPTGTESWSLDALGNWNSDTVNGSTTSRTNSAQNQIQTVTTPTAGGANTTATLGYDANGNTTTDNTGQQYVYDAWNRLVRVVPSYGFGYIAWYGYDAQGRRVTEQVPGLTEQRNLYYSDDWQVLQENLSTEYGTFTTEQDVWSPFDVDRLVERDTPQSAPSDGSPDASFGEDGVAETPLVGGQGTIVPTTGVQGPSQVADPAASAPEEASAVGPDGKLVVALILIDQYQSTPDYVEVFRYNTDGSLDTTFGYGGMTEVYTSSKTVALAIQPDGKILLTVNVSSYEPTETSAVVRLNADGSRDTTFGTGGTAEVPIPGADPFWTQLSTLLLRPDGDIVAVGGSVTNADSSVTVVQLTSTGQLDGTFGNVDDGASQGSGGVVTTLTADEAFGTVTAALQADGKLLVAIGNWTYGSGAYDDEVYRFTATGDVDPTFGDGGHVNLEDLGAQLTPIGIAETADGQILVGGTINDYEAAIARLNGDGSLDPTFGTGGIEDDGSTGGALSMAMTADGRTYLVEAPQGWNQNNGQSQWYYWFQVERFNTQPRTGGRLYAEQDADDNVTSLTNAAGAVVERYVYGPYGQVTVENPDGSVRGNGSAYGWTVLYQGMGFDPATGLYYARNRETYDPSLGRFLQQDPTGGTYVNGPGLYQFVLSNPVNGTDPTGLMRPAPPPNDPNPPYPPPEWPSYSPNDPPPTPPPSSGGVSAGQVAMAGASLIPVYGNYIAAANDFGHDHWGWGIVDVASILADEFGVGEAEAATRTAANIAEDVEKANAAAKVAEDAKKAETAGQAAEDANKACPGKNCFVAGTLVLVHEGDPPSYEASSPWLWLHRWEVTGTGFVVLGSLGYLVMIEVDRRRRRLDSERVPPSPWEALAAWVRREQRRRRLLAGRACGLPPGPFHMLLLEPR